MDRKPIDLNRAETEKEAIDALRVELEKRAAEPKAFTKPFVAHGKPPSSPPPTA